MYGHGGQLAAVLAAALVAVASRAAQAENRCGQNQKPHVLVALEDHELLLCHNGKQEGPAFAIRIGSSGFGKRKEGDRKTPAGEYELGRIRKSKKYGWFIPIGYPTAEQKKQGYTGGAVGIHGPDRRVRWLGRATNWFDTTDGCVGLARDEEVERIGAWMKRTGTSRVRLEP